MKLADMNPDEVVENNVNRADVERCKLLDTKKQSKLTTEESARLRILEHSMRGANELLACLLSGVVITAKTRARPC